MTRFLDLRIAPVGGGLATTVGVCQATNINNYQSLDLGQLLCGIRGQHVLIATHGFNVNRADGIASLSNWEGLLQLPLASAFVGLLWPGDSIWAHGLDYGEEPKLANDAGVLIADFLNTYFASVASISFASHSLGARVILSTIMNLNLPVRRVVIMAGAIDDNCLSTEFQCVESKVAEISVLSSSRDEVLSMAFPLGNFVAGIIAEGHPWWRAALGHTGPAQPMLTNFISPFEIPDNWLFEHGNYLQIDNVPAPVLPIPTEVPTNGSPEPAAGAMGWQESFSAAFVSTRFR
jgi:Alpha/beta hydrolase of unknown function (DUF900)